MENHFEVGDQSFVPMTDDLPSDGVPSIFDDTSARVLPAGLVLQPNEPLIMCDHT
jgi:hypothetical protein